MKKYNYYIFIGLLAVIVVFGFNYVGGNKFSVEGGLIVSDNIVVLPEPSTLMEVQIDTLGKKLPSTKGAGDLPVMLKLTAGGATLNAYGEIKVQGSSTARWPKKNWTLKFYQDKQRTKRLKIKLGDSVASSEWVAKAEWVDPTTIRNALSYSLWEAMTKSRNVFPQYEVDNAWIGKEGMLDGVKLGGQGFPKHHPIHVKVNGEHYGISMLLLGHEPDNFNIDKNNPNHIYMEFDARDGNPFEKTWEKLSEEGIGQWIDGYYPKDRDFTEEQRLAITKLGKLINGSLEDFKTNFDRHLDKTNMIDMLLFLEAIYDYDAVSQDVQMVSYDLEKWYLLPWDKDTTFGMHWNGSGIQKDSSTTLLIDYNTERNPEKPWYKTYHVFTADVESRYAELRDEGVFSVNGLSKLIKEITNKIPNDIWELERVKWEEHNRPSLDDTSIYQIISWFDERLKVLDQHFNYQN